ncbi:MAG TPA: hypothetical protein VMW24_17580 [Sedimentisphaerales bacterium]|nr:hypothetical protein [Sedimentisphaerales bacterium]
MIRTILMLAIAVLIISGCTENDPGWRAIGPYVTDVRFDDDGNLLVTTEKIVTFAPEHVFNRKPGDTVMIKRPQPKQD